ncbi:MAG: GyrI-like domain-containing protein [Bryobacteraceae bacterium]|nr:GyrI-like domain-containing protein [Bryobacteraceae bacterium]
MIEHPVVTETVAQLAAVMQLAIPRNQIQAAMGPGLSEIMETLEAQGIRPAGPWFTHHFKMDPATFDFEICVPVTASVTPVGRVKAGAFPVLTVVRTTYHGGYEGLGAAWGEFKAWIATHGHTTGPDLFECYVVGPDTSPNSADWRTVLWQPLL